VLPFFVGALVAISRVWSLKIKLHFFFLGIERCVPEQLPIDELSKLVRRYVWFYPGAVIVLQRSPEDALVLMRTRDRLIATLRVPGLSSGAVLRGVYNVFVGSEVAHKAPAIRELTVAFDSTAGSYIAGVTSAHI
jgi:hypothetical protein